MCWTEETAVGTDAVEHRGLSVGMIILISGEDSGGHVMSGFPY